ncbi:MAG: penicillin-binding protein [Clostridia bacterium]|nr:penicillin-binding protein [Clostridia bacterium]
MTKRRTIALILLILLVFSVYAARLFEVQIISSDVYVDQTLDSVETRLTIPAARGEILDRNLRALAVNRTAFSIILDGATFPRGTGNARRAAQNRIFSDLTDFLTQHGEQWNDILPISRTFPYSFAADRDSSVSALKKTLRLAAYATADNCMQALVERYGLQEYPAAKQRTLAGIQYSVEIQGLSRSVSYTLAGSITQETAYILKENGAAYPGVVIQASPVRQYVNGDVASHLIGTIGPLYEDEYAELKEKGYKLNDSLGKSGIEAALESVLRGVSGVRSILRNDDGEIWKDYESQPSQAGLSVILTLDAGLQQAAQNALSDKIAELRAQTPTEKKPWIGQDVKSGSVVVLDVKDAGVLACATWPNYDLSSYYFSYTDLLNDPDNPLFNRALHGTFPNGSTMKPAIAVAGLMDQVITPTTKLAACVGHYTFYSEYNFSPKCMGHHGAINVSTALQKSCNVFFYDLGRLLGITRMNYFCRYFGLGEKTGIEIGESAGVLAGPEEREKAGGNWAAGDTVMAAIGQSDNRFTPLQLAAYAATLANNGVRYKAHLVHSIREADGTVVSVTEPEILSALDIPDNVSKIVRDAMISVTKPGGTAANAFKDAAYSLAAKTGTAEGSSANQSDHGIFIAYAPAENPQVAIAVVLECGTSAASSEVARTVLDAYFDATP